MASQQLQLVCDSSTLANFKQWAKPISDWMRTLGFTDAGDTGQLNGNGNGNWAAVAGVPGSGAYFYEMFKSPETPYYYVQLMYGNVTGTNCPSLQIGIGTSTDGAGTLTSYVVGPLKTNITAFTPPSTTTQYECNFSGSGGDRVAVMMWRNAPSNAPQIFAIERSLDAAGAYTGSYLTLYVGGYQNLYGPFQQQSLMFGVGACRTSTRGSSRDNGGLFVRGVNASTAFNNSLAADFATPNIGYWDRPGTVIGSGWGADYAEGVTFSMAWYGTTMTFMPSKTGPFGQAGPTNAPSYCVLMRYD